MSERMHPVEEQALALIEDERFCGRLDSRVATSRSNGWYHNRFSARRWLEYQCGVTDLSYLGIDADAWHNFRYVLGQFRAWLAQEKETSDAIA